MLLHCLAEHCGHAKLVIHFHSPIYTVLFFIMQQTKNCVMKKCVTVNAARYILLFFLKLLDVVNIELLCFY